MRLFLAAVILAGLSAGRVAFQHSVARADATVSLTVTPSSSDQQGARVLSAQGLPAGTHVTVAVFDPGGEEWIDTPSTDATGNVVDALQPPEGNWSLGLYRVVVGLPSGEAWSTVFAEGDGGPHIATASGTLSSWSVLNVMGSGLPAEQSLQLTISPANFRAPHSFTVQTGADGSLSASFWPQQFGENFWEAGYYQIDIPSLSLSVQIMAHEWPTAPVVRTDGTAISGGTLGVHLLNYVPQRYVWMPYASEDGSVTGDLLLGPIGGDRKLDVSAQLPVVPAGTYLIGSPYEWGEDQFVVMAPTDTPTETPTMTPTATPIPTSTPRPKPHHCKAGFHRVHGKCKRRK